MNIELPYGSTKKTIRVPDDVKADFLIPQAGSAIQDLEAALVESFLSPVDSLPLDELLKGSGSVVILVSDLTRDAGTSVLLPFCVKYIRSLGVSPSRIKIVIARGTHRRLSKEEKQFFRTGELRGVSLLEHDCDDSSSLEALLLTTRGTPVRVNRAMKDADLAIILAPLSFHYFAGFGGGRKLILPGCSDRQSILANHRLSLLDTKPVRLNPLAHVGVLEGNPVHEDMCEALDALDNVFGINFFSDTSGNIVFVNAGSPKVSHAAACEHYGKQFTLSLSHPYDVLLLSAGGSPYDINLLQSHKALRNASYAVRKEGTILFLAQCPEQLGSSMLESALEKPKDAFLREAYKNYELNNQSAVSLYGLAGEFTIGMITDLNTNWLDKLGVMLCDNVEAFIAEALSKSGSLRIAVLPHGSKTLLELTGEASE